MAGCGASASPSTRTTPSARAVLARGRMRGARPTAWRRGTRRAEDRATIARELRRAAPTSCACSAATARSCAAASAHRRDGGAGAGHQPRARSASWPRSRPIDLERALDQVLAGDYDRRGAVPDRGDHRRARTGREERHACLNEVVVARGSRVRMIRLEVEVSGIAPGDVRRRCGGGRDADRARPPTASARVARSWTRGCAT